MHMSPADDIWGESRKSSSPYIIVSKVYAKALAKCDQFSNQAVENSRTYRSKRKQHQEQDVTKHNVSADRGENDAPE